MAAFREARKTLCLARETIIPLSQPATTVPLPLFAFFELFPFPLEAQAFLLFFFSHHLVLHSCLSLSLLFSLLYCHPSSILCFTYSPSRNPFFSSGNPSLECSHIFPFRVSIFPFTVLLFPPKKRGKRGTVVRFAVASHASTLKSSKITARILFSSLFLSFSRASMFFFFYLSSLKKRVKRRFTSTKKIEQHRRENMIFFLVEKASRGGGGGEKWM